MYKTVGEWLIIVFAASGGAVVGYLVADALEKIGRWLKCRKR